MDKRQPPKDFDRPHPARVRTKSGHPELPLALAIELEQVAHFGKADLVKQAIVDAGHAYEIGDYAAAYSHAKQAKTMAPRASVVREMSGLAAYRMGLWKEAAREISAYRRLSGRQDEDHIFADCERAIGRPDRALEILDESRDSETEEELVVERLLVAAGCLNDLGRHDDAVERLKAGPSNPPVVIEHHLRLWYALADSLERAGRRPEARVWWDLIYAEEPEFFDVASRRLGTKAPD